MRDILFHHKELFHFLIHSIPYYKTKAKFYMILFFFELSKITDWDMQENDS
jgi:hypothetical protein